MSTYDFGDHGRMDLSDGPPDLRTLMAAADRLTEALRAEYPGLAGWGESVQRELALSAEDGLPPNRGRIRTALEEVAIVASAGTGSLSFTRQLLHALGL
ncbi:hypothetical protein [Streptomyces camelliae]|uniref:Uncharacterized protein n=1 Tax=Streptomyces camelliae TaxID=3004093 RepID=A0ABY7NYE8_9ACTN|nr:hypothetical protein [Streptomyces sp. HUAS 2-6]WBO63090.1 hypothetical protein O1G22_09755 [Streptomyces sp. HUAS 2-6]